MKRITTITVLVAAALLVVGSGAAFAQPAADTDAEPPTYIMDGTVTDAEPVNIPIGTQKAISDAPSFVIDEPGGAATPVTEPICCGNEDAPRFLCPWDAR